MVKKFTKTKENFVCGRCGRTVKGDGYTNHCPFCLWSCHRDVNPGDRQEECGGLMEPVDIYLRNQDWIIIHHCRRCGWKSKNKIRPEDDFDEVVRLEKKINEKKVKE